MSATLNCARGCTQPGRHAPNTQVCDQCACHNGPPGAYPCTVPGGCHQHHTPHDDTTCYGCLPAPADTPSLVCARCTRTATDALGIPRPHPHDNTPIALADLYAWLGDPLRAQTYTAHTSTAGAPEACPDCDQGNPCDRDHRGAPQTLRSEAIDIRHRITTTLDTWCRRLATDPHYQITYPGLTAHAHNTARTTRALTAHHRAQADQAAHWLALAAKPHTDGTPPDPTEITAARAEQRRHLNAAADAQHQRETGRDVIAALAEHLARHLPNLLEDNELVTQLVDDLEATAHTARRLLPGGTRGTMRIQCPCGGRVPVSIDDWMTCPDCGQHGVLSWWIEHNTADVAEHLTVYDGAAWLLVQHGIDLGTAGPSRLRQWAARYPEDLPKTGVDSRGRTLYERDRFLALARRLIPAARRA